MAVHKKMTRAGTSQSNQDGKVALLGDAANWLHFQLLTVLLLTLVILTKTEMPMRDGGSRCITRPETTCTLNKGAFDVEGNS